MNSSPSSVPNCVIALTLSAALVVLRGDIGPQERISVGEEGRIHLAAVYHGSGEGHAVQPEGLLPGGHAPQVLCVKFPLKDFGFQRVDDLTSPLLELPPNILTYRLTDCKHKHEVKQGPKCRLQE